MSQIDAQLSWCLKDPKRLVKIKPDLEQAKKHLEKSDHNYKIMLQLQQLKIYDWGLNIGFYAIYHCFLAILAKYGYSSKNQLCTITCILSLINENKLNLDKDLVLQFDTLDGEKELTSNTIRQKREVSTYGVETSINLDELKKLKELIVKIQRETIKIIEE